MLLKSLRGRTPAWNQGASVPNCWREPRCALFDMCPREAGAHRYCHLEDGTTFVSPGSSLTTW